MATSYLSPGVYIEEVDRGSKPIEAVGTSTAAFIGESSVGPTNEAVLVTNWAQYTRTFGDFSHSTHLAHAVYGFFNNGGTKAFICNVSPKTMTGAGASATRWMRSRTASMASLWPMMLAAENRVRSTDFNADASRLTRTSSNARSRKRASSSCLNGFVR